MIFACCVGQTFLSAGSGDFPVARSSFTGQESPVNWQAGKPAPGVWTAYRDESSNCGLCPSLCRPLCRSGFIRTPPPGHVFVPSTCPSRCLGGKIQCLVVNLQFFVIEHLTRTRSVPTKCATKCLEKGDRSGTSADSKCPNSRLGLVLRTQPQPVSRTFRW